MIFAVESAHDHSPADAEAQAEADVAPALTRPAAATA